MISYEDSIEGGKSIIQFVEYKKFINNLSYYVGYLCTEDCHGRMGQEYDEALLYNQLKYLVIIFLIFQLLFLKPHITKNLSVFSNIRFAC